jgi:hypothetical protein
VSGGFDVSHCERDYLDRVASDLIRPDVSDGSKAEKLKSKVAFDHRSGCFVLKKMEFLRTNESHRSAPPIAPEI